ncbi:energy transducer TonB [Nitratidesulfovibrio oxamicus]|uniref:energy transducer TonB n=1 Tax=Nitratidesulfovibrio oxamicus TaxID=32016 RepID=UPI0027DE6EE6|nr:energy transducer TonB [Nitratidesulfovibrio oxamicus]
MSSMRPTTRLLSAACRVACLAVWLLACACPWTSASAATNGRLGVDSPEAIGASGSQAAQDTDLPQQASSSPRDRFTRQVMAIVCCHWEFPALANRENLMVQVRVKVAPNGQIRDFSVEQSSGRADFDASALRALGKTGMLPPPPSPENQDLLLTFNLQEMIGKR